MEEVETEIVYKKRNMVSYGFGSLAREFLSMAFTTAVFFYYEAEIGLSGWFVVSGIILFAIYNMFNDPIIGYLTNRPFKFTKKWGRRFPWLILGGIPFGLSYILVFLPPSVDPVADAWIIFAWLVFTTCLFDTFHSLYFVNFMSLFTEKYRSIKERRLASGIYVPFGVVGVALGAIIPPLLFDFENIPSYTFQGVIVFIIIIFFLILAIPGLRDNRENVEDYLNTYDQAPKRDSFFKTFKTALKQRSFLAWMFLYVMYFSLINTMQNSLYYTVKYILKMESEASTLIFAGFLIGAIASTPLWVKLSHKLNNNKKVILIAAILLGVFVSPLIFLENYYAIVITMVIWGIGLGGFWFMIFPVNSDVIDESVVRTGKREEGIYSGFTQFFGRLGIVSQAVTFGVVHALTGFIEGAPSQVDSALWGIHIHLGLIPMIFILIGALAFWKFYDLTPQRIAENTEKLKEMGLR